MDLEQQQATLGIALLAAFADGDNSNAERELIHRLADTLGAATAIDLQRLYQRVLLQQVELGELIRPLQQRTERQFAYEMAVSVCDADGVQSEAERGFLAQLRQQLGLDAAQARQLEHQANALTEAAQVTPGRQSGIRQDELDRSILNYALLNGALELLPQSWASLAIIPLQVRMVYGIGRAHGVELDQGHIREFITTLGVGLTSQYLEGIGRRILGGLLGSLGSGATGIAFSFATTYAMGQVARRYYAGGRQMDTGLLRESYQQLLGDARRLQTELLPQIRDKAANLDFDEIMKLVRGGS